MATEKWIAGSGQGLTWGSAFGTEVNLLASAKSVLSSVSITNGTALDIFADISVALGSAAFTAVTLAFYIYGLNEDGSTYGDGQFGSAATGAPAAQYFAGIIPIVAATQAQTGMCRGIILPPGTFKFVISNQTGVALAASNTVSYRTYNRSIV